MYNDVLNKNHNKVMDILFGYGYVSKLEYIEKDYIGQVAIMGVTGTICLVGPYLLCFLISILSALKRLKNSFKIENIILGATIAECLCIAYIAGYLFGNIFPMVFFILILKCFNDYVHGVAKA